MPLKTKEGIQPQLREVFDALDIPFDDLDLPMAAEASLGGDDSTTAELHAKVNAILTKMRTAGLLSS